jgi:hypothetical protein
VIQEKQKDGDFSPPEKRALNTPDKQVQNSTKKAMISHRPKTRTGHA